MSNRDNFPPNVINSSKLRAAYICSNPSCKKSTIAPSDRDEMKVEYCGKVAHIVAASKDGPRGDSNIPSEEIMSIGNAIFLCSNCADLIDKNNGIDYPTVLLKLWKKKHLAWVKDNLNKDQSIHATNHFTSTHQLGGIAANNVYINNPINETPKTQIKHDLDIYKKIDAIFSEYSIKSFVDELNNSGSCQVDDPNKLQEVYDFFSLAGNTFLSDLIEAAKKKFIKTIKPLCDYISGNFDKWPYEQSKLNFIIQLKPEFLRDTGYRELQPGDRAKWDKLYNQLLIHVKKLYSAYKELRLAIKSELYI